MTPSNISHAFYSEKISPSNDSKQKDDNGDMNGMSAKLLKSRTVIISQQVNSDTTRFSCSSSVTPFFTASDHR